MLISIKSWKSLNGGTVPANSIHLRGTFVYCELPLTQMSIDAGWPCLQLAFWKCLLACRTIEKRNKSYLHPLPPCIHSSMFALDNPTDHPCPPPLPI